MSVLEVDGLTRRFGGLVAVDDLAFRVEGGEILGLIGPNGSGKSTTLSLIMGLYRPSSGSIRFDGDELAGLPAYRIARLGVSIVFQHSRPLHRQSVLEHIRLALLPDSLWQMLHDPSVTRKAIGIAERVGLAEVMDRLPDTLPFADLRRLELAKAIARDPRLILVDEPFAGLTPAEIQDFSKLIGGLRAEGCAVVLVDHNVKGVSSLVDRIIAMHAGRKIAEGKPNEVVASERVREVYLGGAFEGGAHMPATVAADREPLLDISGLSVHYAKAQALDQASIRVHEGESVAVVGLNGAGKTTLFNAISGMVPYGGEVRYAGQSLAGWDAGRIARSGIVQCPETRELFGDLSVRENLDLAGQRLTPPQYAETEAWLYNLFPVLAQRQRQLARTLSGGEQQMLTIARGLMTRPRLFILDEPTLGLAPIVLKQISDALEVLRREVNITLLLGEQNLTFALRHTERIYLLEHGRVIWQGPTAEFSTDVAERYL
ncbi:MAG: ATP-binding cassette domain-containing protein [Gemmatimonas sp.]